MRRIKFFIIFLFLKLRKFLGIYFKEIKNEMEVCVL